MAKVPKKSSAKKSSAKRAKRKKPLERSVLSMTPKQARSFFLKPESYCRVELPPYVDFGRVLRPVTAFLDGKKLESASSKPRTQESVNYTIYSNKDGRYAWRPFQLIHPAIYVNLVNAISEPGAWTYIKKRFAMFAVDPKIRCLSIPVASLTRRKDRAAQVRKWWQGIEQASIELALDYSYAYHADITDCYGSIYTHSIVWAMHSKPVAQSKAGKQDASLIGNVIDWSIQDMRQGQTNGIPQGSALADLIAEIVLGYADLELSGLLAKRGVSDFKILRYRDDYRVFVNSHQVGEQVLKALTEVLLMVGLKLSAAKTSCALPVIASSLKNDKKQWMRARQVDRSLQKHLLLIHCHSSEFPNAGSLLHALDQFYRRLTEAKSVPNVVQLISIAVDIGFHSPRCFPVCAAIISVLVGRYGSKKEKIDALARVRMKFAQLPNNGHLEVWLQRISHAFDASIDYSERLCKIVKGENLSLWNSAWVTAKGLRDALNHGKIINQTILKGMKPIVAPDEFALFAWDY